MIFKQSLIICFVSLVISSFSFAQTQSVIVYNQPGLFFKSSIKDIKKAYTVVNRTKVNLSAKQHSTGLFMRSNQDSIEALEIETELSVEQLCNQLKQLPTVKFAEPNYEINLYSTSNRAGDPLQKNQNYLFVNDLYKIWNFKASSDTIVAVIDTGVDLAHEDLADSIYSNAKETLNGKDDDGNGYIDDVNGYSWISYTNQNLSNNSTDDHGHGTHIAGIIAANHNSVGISGIHPTATVLPLKVFNYLGRGRQLEAAAAIRYAVDMGASIINCSWGFYRKTVTLESAINYALNNGVIVVAAVGNSGVDYPMYPANFSQVIGVGSIDEIQHQKESYSNFGNALDFVVSGRNIFSSGHNNSYSRLTGTSQSTAILSGIIARLKSYNATLSLDDIMSLLIKNSTENTQRKNTIGYGIPKITGIMADFNVLDNREIASDFPVLTTQSISSDQLENVMVVPNPIKTQTASFQFSTNTAGLEIEISIYNLEGIKQTQTTYSSTLGLNTVNLNVDSLNNGLYFYILKVAQTGEIHKGKCVLLR